MEESKMEVPRTSIGADSTSSKETRLGQTPTPPTGKKDLEKAEPGLDVHDSLSIHEPGASEWDGDNDPENPMNWSFAKKMYHGSIPSIYCFTITFGSSVYTPGVFYVQHQFHTSTTVALLPLSLFVLGIAFGPMLAAPISETYGRRPVYFLCLPIFGLFILGAGFSKNLASLLVTRFLAGVFGSPALSVGAGTCADLFPPEKRALVTGFFVATPFLGTVLGPVIGGYVAEKKGWVWTQWTLLFFVAASILFSVAMHETYAKTLLESRARKRGIQITKTGPKGAAAAKMLITVTLLRPVRMLFVEPIVGFLSLYVAFNFAVVFGFFDAYPIVFAGIYHFTLGEVGLTFLGLGVGGFLAVPTFLLIDRLTYQKQHRASHVAGRKGIVAPEHRLYAAMIGSIGIPIGLFWFAWTAKKGVHWASPVMAAVPFGWGNLLVFFSAALYIIDTYGALNGASAMAANGLLRYVLGAAFPLFTVQMYNRLGVNWATSLLGFVSLALLPVPWVLFKWGPQIRGKSYYETIVIPRANA